MYFLSPTFLWALIGLIIPIAIHLWSKKEGRTIKVGSVQLLRPSESTKSSAIHLNEWWLLLLRILLIILIVGILAEPRLQQPEKPISLAYVIEPSLLLEDRLNTVLDSVNDDVPIHLFMEGFPLLGDRTELETSSVKTPLYWQLAQQLTTLSADSLVVFTKATMSGIKGMRPSIPSKIHFVTVPSERNDIGALFAIKEEDGVEVNSLRNVKDNMEFSRELLQEADSRLQRNTTNDSIYWQEENRSAMLPIREHPSSRIQLYYNSEYEQDKNYVEAALRAISAYDEIDVTFSLLEEGTEPSKENDLTIWLSKESPPNIPGKLLQSKEEALDRDIISKGTAATQFFITERLNSKNVFSAHFTKALFQLIVADEDLEEMLQANNLSAMDAQQFTPAKNDTKTSGATRNDADIAHWFWFLLIPVILGERLLSKFRKQ